MVKRKNYIDKDVLHHLSKDFEQLLSNRFHPLTLENDIDDHTSNIVDIIEEQLHLWPVVKGSQTSKNSLLKQNS